MKFRGLYLENGTSKSHAVFCKCKVKVRGIGWQVGRGILRVVKLRSTSGFRFFQGYEGFWGFGFEIPDEEAEKISTVQDAFDYIKNHTN